MRTTELLIGTRAQLEEHFKFVMGEYPTIERINEQMPDATNEERCAEHARAVAEYQSHCIDEDKIIPAAKTFLGFSISAQLIEFEARKPSFGHVIYVKQEMREPTSEGGIPEIDCFLTGAFVFITWGAVFHHSCNANATFTLKEKEQNEEG